MFKITDYVEFNEALRGSCPSCEAAKGKPNTNLSLLETGAYHCYAGCAPKMVRAALGDRQPLANPQPAQTKKLTKPVTCTPQEVKKDYHRLLENKEAIAWLENRGISQELMARHQLGVKPITVMVNRQKVSALGISVPIPANSDLTHYYRKYRVQPWAEDKDLPKWHQPGVPATVWFTHKPAEAVETWLCEGEWDAIRLGEIVRRSGKGNIAVASFTCGANTVPSKPELDRLVGKVSIFYDRNDTPLANGTKPGEEGAKKVAKALGDRATIKLVPGNDEQVNAVKGWDVSNALDAGYTFNDFANSQIPTVTEDANPEIARELARTKKGRLLLALTEMFKDKLRYNEMSKSIETDSGEVLDPDFVYLNLLQQGIDVGSKEFAIDVFNYLAKQRKFHPVAHYLEQVHEKHGNQGEALLNTAAQRYLGTDNPLYNSFVRKTLIAAVARALSPGCKVDTALIFTGRQGQYKSTFWAILAGDWFCDSLSNQTSEADEKLKLYSAWIHEWAELETVFRRKENSQVKGFLSARTDTFRQPWGRTTEKHQRHSIIVGTTNEDDFLTDPTGARRYWVIPIQQPISIELLERERDFLWAAAVSAYKQGQPWTLSPQEAAQSEELNKRYQSEDPWHQRIGEWLRHRNEVRVTEILGEVIGLELAKQDRIAQMRVAVCLKNLGWQKKHTELGKIWVRGSQVVSQSLEPSQGKDYKADYLYPLSSQEVVSSHEDNNSLLTTRGVVSPDYLSAEVVSPESVADRGFKAPPDYLTTKKPLKTFQVLNEKMHESPEHPSGKDSKAFVSPMYQTGDPLWVLVSGNWVEGVYDRPLNKLVVSPQVTGLHDCHRVMVDRQPHLVTIHEIRGIHP